MTYTIEILNPDFVPVETMSIPYQPAVMVTDHTGRHSEPQTFLEYLGDVEELARMGLDERPGHTAILFDFKGDVMAVLDGED
jgi:hypothetical protein